MGADLESQTSGEEQESNEGSGFAVNATVTALSRREERKQEFRAHISAAMERALADTPFPDVTIDRILAEAGVSRSTLYSYFPDKVTLLLSIAEDVVAGAHAAAARWWELADQPSREDLKSILGAILDLYLEHKHVLAALVDASAYEPKLRGQLGGLFVEGSREGLAQHIIAGQRAGTVRPELVPHETAGWLIWMIERGLYTMAVPAKPSQVGALLHSVTDIIWFTLYVDSATGVQ